MCVCSYNSQVYIYLCMYMYVYVDLIALSKLYLQCITTL